MLYHDPVRLLERKDIHCQPRLLLRIGRHHLENRIYLGKQPTWCNAGKRSLLVSHCQLLKTCRFSFQSVDVSRLVRSSKFPSAVSRMFCSCFFFFFFVKLNSTVRAPGRSLGTDHISRRSPVVNSRSKEPRLKPSLTISQQEVFSFHTFGKTTPHSHSLGEAGWTRPPTQVRRATGHPHPHQNPRNLWNFKPQMHPLGTAATLRIGGSRGVSTVPSRIPDCRERDMEPLQLSSFRPLPRLAKDAARYAK